MQNLSFFSKSVFLLSLFSMCALPLTAAEKAPKVVVVSDLSVVQASSALGAKPRAVRLKVE